jgi:antitoxin component YwqK of YwqJK toxin-antitoxin module
MLIQLELIVDEYLIYCECTYRDDGTKSEEIYYKAGFRHGTATDYYANGSTCATEYKNGTRHRNHIVRYKSGQIRYMLTYNHGKIVDGSTLEWYENGQLKSTYGDPVGCLKEWYENGKLKCIPMESYMDGMILELERVYGI